MRREFDTGINYNKVDLTTGGVTIPLVPEGEKGRGEVPLPGGKTLVWNVEKHTKTRPGGAPTVGRMGEVVVEYRVGNKPKMSVALRPGERWPDEGFIIVHNAP